MLRPSSDISDLMHTVACYIEIEEYIGGSGAVEVANSTKPTAKKVKKQVNAVAKKEGNGDKVNRGGGKTWDRLPRDGRDHLAITTYFKTFS